MGLLASIGALAEGQPKADDDKAQRLIASPTGTRSVECED
jgi:hypothetical protein